MDGHVGILNLGDVEVEAGPSTPSAALAAPATAPTPIPTEAPTAPTTGYPTAAPTTAPTEIPLRFLTSEQDACVLGGKMDLRWRVLASDGPNTKVEFVVSLNGTAWLVRGDSSCTLT
jgi:hypothetical protein